MFFTSEPSRAGEINLSVQMSSDFYKKGRMWNPPYKIL